MVGFRTVLLAFGLVIICCLSEADAFCLIGCRPPSEGEAERLIRPSVGRERLGSVGLITEFRLGQRDDLTALKNRRKTVEAALKTLSPCKTSFFSCDDLIKLAQHKLIKAVNWGACRSNHEFLCALLVFTQSTRDAIKRYRIKRYRMASDRGGAIEVKTEEARFLRVVRVKGDGRAARAQYELEYIPTIFGAALANVQRRRQLKEVMLFKYNDGWRLGPCVLC